MKLRFVLLLTVCLSAAWARSIGPGIRRTGAPVDGGLTCAGCHRTYEQDSDSRGRITIVASEYTPGVKQIIRVIVQHPEAKRWGFQLTARLTADETKTAGTFTVANGVQVLCAPAGAAAPCSGENEFAEHTQPITTLGSDGRMVFEVEWTPPDAKQGNVIFYAAGNAANGDGTNQGDHIYTTSWVVKPAEDCPITGQPAIRSVFHATGNGATLPFNSLFTIQGNGFAPRGTVRPVTASDLDNGMFPKSHACLAVEIEGLRAPIVYVSDIQVNAQMPTVIFDKPVRVQVIMNPGRMTEMRSGEVMVSTAKVVPAFYLFPNSSVAALQADLKTPIADPADVPSGRPVKAGDYATLFASGLGTTNPTWQAGEIPTGMAGLDQALTLTIGGIAVPAENITYAGLSPGSSSGLYQINVKIPESAPAGKQPVVIQVAGVSSATGTTLPVTK